MQFLFQQKDWLEENTLEDKSDFYLKKKKTTDSYTHLVALLWPWPLERKTFPTYCKEKLHDSAVQKGLPPGLRWL